MTMLALAFSKDLCIIAADRAVGRVDKDKLSTSTEKTTKLKYYNNPDILFVVTAAGLSGAVESVPDLLKSNPIKNPEDICAVAMHLAKFMKNNLPKDFWSQTHTTSCWLALTSDNLFFTHAFYLNDEEVLFSGFEPQKSEIPAGFSAPELVERKVMWEKEITNAIQPVSATDSPEERLQRTLSKLSDAFKDCASLNEFVSQEFDYCVISKENRKVFFNELPSLKNQMPS